METTTKLVRILSYPVVFEIVRFIVFVSVGGAFAQTGVLDKLSIAITVVLYAWIGWRTWVRVEGGFMMALFASFIYSLILLLLSVVAASLNFGMLDKSSTPSLWDAVPGLIISFVFFFLPIALVTTLVTWYVSRKLKSSE